MYTLRQGSHDGATTTTAYDQTVSHALLNMLSAYQDPSYANTSSPFNPNETLFILEKGAMKEKNLKERTSGGLTMSHFKNASEPPLSGRRK